MKKVAEWLDSKEDSAIWQYLFKARRSRRRYSTPLVVAPLGGVKMPVTYTELKAAYEEAGRVEALAAEHNHSDLIQILAEAKNDEHWPLAILGKINADLAGALRAWTACHSLEMSCIQKRRSPRESRPA